jgi:hypothetical protein
LGSDGEGNKTSGGKEPGLHVAPRKLGRVNDKTIFRAAQDGPCAATPQNRNAP